MVSLKPRERMESGWQCCSMGQIVERLASAGQQHERDCPPELPISISNLEINNLETSGGVRAGRSAVVGIEWFEVADVSLAALCIGVPVAGVA
jgi:hypothetical protein